MDLKSMAKSKRSHTQHHQPRKPHHSSKATASSSSTASKKDIRDRKRAIQQPPSLPSNWDRYEDEQEQMESEEMPISINAGSNESGQPAMSKKVRDEDVIKPKSKGADFRDLITQAQESRTYYSPSFDDKVPGNFSHSLSIVIYSIANSLALKFIDFNTKIL